MSEVKIYKDTPIPGRWQQFWQRYRRHKGAMLGLMFLLVILMFALFSPLLAPHDPTEQFSQFLRYPPAWTEKGINEFLLGTDDLGRDLFSRIVYGSRLSLGLSAAVVLIAALFGILLGAIAGLSKGIIEFAIMRIMDIILAVPSLLLAIVIIAIIGPGLPNAIYAVAIVLIPHFVRIVRATIKEEMNKDYVIAAKLDGANGARLFTHSILPNILPPLIVQVSLAFSTAIVDIAALGFLGLGAQPPNPEWGTILSQSRDFIQLAPWTVTIPGLAILITVLSINLVGDGLRDALDPMESRG
ncbi:ABC transporter permease subunit [Pleionea mediterranea]|jgi:dipeptide transport system permease protein|uniref:Dipeptide transport system permease protein n=1 Tax=Pleionea mediterranea TaxID=523701 RepID=A0A316G0W4_9GAMM|nr:ABC transporter permease subunit [Pleionea mediterranea]PWK54489.1 dipeptide transport system permease protein [Pleionea mediterranea]